MVALWQGERKPTETAHPIPFRCVLTDPKFAEVGQPEAESFSLRGFR